MNEPQLFTRDTPSVTVTPRDAAPTPPRHEENTVNAWSIVMFGAGLILLTIVALLVAQGMLKAFSTQIEQADPPPSPVAATRQPPPQPRLQVTPGQDLQQLRAAQDAILYSYGWVDRAQGIVRIPIHRAIELLAERGLPVRAADRGTQSQRGASQP